MFNLKAHESLIVDLSSVLQAFTKTTSEFEIRKVIHERKRTLIFGAAASALEKISKKYEGKFDMVNENNDVLVRTTQDAPGSVKILAFIMNTCVSSDSHKRDPNSDVYKITEFHERHAGFMKPLMKMLSGKMDKEMSENIDTCYTVAKFFSNHFDSNAKPAYMDNLPGQCSHEYICNLVIQICNCVINAVDAGENPELKFAKFSIEGRTVFTPSSRFVVEGSSEINPIFANAERITKIVYSVSNIAGLCVRENSDRPKVAPKCKTRAGTMSKSHSLDITDVMATLSEIPPCMLCDSFNLMYADDVVSVVERIEGDTVVRDIEKGSGETCAARVLAYTVSSLFGIYRGNENFDGELGKCLKWVAGDSVDVD